MHSTLTAKNEYAVSFTKQQKKFSLSLHYNEADSYLFVNGLEIYQFNTNNSEINAAPLCYGIVSIGLSVDNMEKT